MVGDIGISSGVKSRVLAIPVRACVDGCGRENLVGKGCGKGVVG